MRLWELICQFFHIKQRYKEDIEKGIFVLHGEIRDNNAYDLIAKILSYSDTSPNEVTLYINSTGGLMSAGFAIYDVLCAIPNTIKVICVKNVGGIALLVASAGTVNKRFYFSRTHFVLGKFSTNDSDSSGNMDGLINDIIEKYYSCLSDNTGVSKEEFRFYTKNKKLPKEFLQRMGFVKYKE